jgi:outer membrane lipoprotein-sorting protein
MKYLFVFVFVLILGCQPTPKFSVSVSPQQQAKKKPMTPIERLNNLNSQVQTLTADVQTIIRRRPVVITLQGKLSYEREKYFRLTNYNQKGQFTSDIGSNNEYFWIYAKRISASKLYYCYYKDLEQTQIDNSLNPMWMLECLGLGSIHENVTIRSQNNLLVVYEKRTGIMNIPVWKATIIDPKKPVMMTHYLYDNHKQIIAQVKVQDYYKFGELYVPKTVEFYWAQENATAEIYFTNWKFNKSITTDTWDLPKLNVKIVDMSKK